MGVEDYGGKNWVDLGGVSHQLIAANLNKINPVGFAWKDPVTAFQLNVAPIIWQVNNAFVEFPGTSIVVPANDTSYIYLDGNEAPGVGQLKQQLGGMPDPSVLGPMRAIAIVATNSTEITGVFPVYQTDSGVSKNKIPYSAFTSIGSILQGAGAGLLSELGPGSAGQFLQSQGAGNPLTWAAALGFQVLAAGSPAINNTGSPVVESAYEWNEIFRVGNAIQIDGSDAEVINISENGKYLAFAMAMIGQDPNFAPATEGYLRVEQPINTVKARARMQMPNGGPGFESRIGAVHVLAPFVVAGAPTTLALTNTADFVDYFGTEAENIIVVIKVPE